MRRLVGAGLPAFCRLLGVDPGAGPEVLGGRFPGRVLEADLLVRTGPGRLLHVEYQLRAEPGLAVRMLRYRAAIAAAYPGHELEQVVVVLRHGRLDSADSRQDGGFRLGCREVRLRDLPPEVLLRDPGTAPLAVLARGDATVRVRAFGRALEVIAGLGPGETAAELAEVASVLATVRLSPRTIEKIRKEAGVTLDDIVDFYGQTFIADIFKEQGKELGKAEGLEQGREQGLEQGLEQGRAESLRALLVERFGEHPDVDAVAARLAAGHDVAASFRAVLKAGSVEDLLA